MMDPATELALNAMGYGVMMALEDPHGLRAKVLAVGPGGTLADALRADAEAFCVTRADLVQAVRQ